MKAITEIALEDTAKQQMLPLGDVRRRRTRRPVWGGLHISASKKDFLRSNDSAGWRTSTGRIYFLCPFHKERTPSCVWYPKGSKAPVDSTSRYCHPSRTNHFRCYGCGKTGTVFALVAALRDHHGRRPPPPKVVWEEGDDDRDIPS